MKINRIALKNFRSYESAVFEFGDGVNVISGANGLGKTNLLESIYLLSGSKSWRTAKNTELIRWDSNGAYISADIVSRGRDFRMNISMPASRRGSVTVNDVPVRKRSKMSEIIRCVIFSPEDLFMIKGAPSCRRELLDDVLCQTGTRYQDSLSRYNRVLDSKRQILKGVGDISLLTEYNIQLAYYGSMIAAARQALCIKLRDSARELHRQISDGKEELDISYSTVSSVTDPENEKKTAAQMLERLSELKNAEIASQSCLVGIHRDDMVFSLNGRDAKAYASQGQSRTAAVAVKFAQRELLCCDGEYPLLLLDDVLSELDAPRQRFITGNALNGQTFISCCLMPDISGARLIELE